MSDSRIAIEHAIEGREPPHDELRCAKCSARLSEGQPVTASVERIDHSWTVAHLWDVDCAPTTCESVVEPAIVEGDIAVVADAARQRHYSVLVDVVVADQRREVRA